MASSSTPDRGGTVLDTHEKPGVDPLHFLSQDVEVFGDDDRFRSLREGSDEEILREAVRWGFLGLCQHDLPYWHQAGCGQASRESVAAWRLWATGVDVVLEMASTLWKGKSCSNGSRNALAEFHYKTGGRQLHWSPIAGDAPAIVQGLLTLAGLGGALSEAPLLSTSWPGKPDIADSRNLAIEINRWIALGHPTIT